MVSALRLAAGLALLLIPAVDALAQEGSARPTPPLDLVSGKPVALSSTGPGPVATANAADACDRYAAPFFRGGGGFVVEPKNGRSADLTVQQAGQSDTRKVVAGRDGLVVDLLSSPLCTGPNGVFPAQCQVSFSGIRGGGWYWVNGDRNAAVAPLVCQEDLGGGPAPLDPGGVQTLPSRWGTGTLFVHDTQGLMGIVPQLSPTGRGATPSCERYVAPFFRGSGGFVAKPGSGQTAEVVIERGSSMKRRPISPRSDGLSVQLLSDSLCTDANGGPVECKVSFSGIGAGGWYWVNGDRNAAVAPLVCEGRLAGSPAVVPGGVRASRAAFGTGSLFEHETQRLMGIVPHLPDSPDDQGEVEVRVSVFGGGSIDVVGGGELDCPDPRLCSGFFPAAGSVTLRPVDPVGYEFDAWQGCDSVIGDACVVALHEDRDLSVDFLSTRPLTMKANVVEFGWRRLNDIKRYDPASGLIVLSANARTHDIGAGTVLVSSVIDPNRSFKSYFLRRVRDVKKLPGSLAYLKTTPAQLTDLIAEGTLAVRGALGSESVSSYVLPSELTPAGHPASDLTVRELADGRRVYEVSADAEPGNVAAMSSSPAANRPPERATDAATVPIPPIGFEVNANIPDDEGNIVAKVTGSISLSFTLNLLMDLAAGLPPWNEALASVDVTATSELQVDPMIDKEFEEEYRLKNVELLFNKLLESAELAAAGSTGGVTKVLVNPEVGVKIFLKVGVKTGFKPKAELQVRARAGFHAKGAEFRNLSLFRYSADLALFEKPPEGFVEAGVFVDLSTLIFSMIGPSAAIEPYLNTRVYVPPDPECSWDYEVRVGARLKAGVKAKLWSWTPGWEQYVEIADLNYTTPLGNSNCVPDVEAEPPGRPALTFDGVGSSSLTVEWKDVNDGSAGAVGYELERTSEGVEGTMKVGSLADSRYVDDSVLPGRTYCYKVRSYWVKTGLGSASDWGEGCETTKAQPEGAPGAPTGLRAEAKSTGVVALTWKEAPEGESVSRYAVLELVERSGVRERFEVGSSVEPRFVVAGLNPETKYCFAVRAVDASGKTSDYGEEVCETARARDEAKWRFRIACRGQDYQIDEFVDLDEQYADIIATVGEGEDYHGAKLMFAMTGPYDNASGVFDGTIDWTFEGTWDARRDTFQVNLRSREGDKAPGKDIAMTKEGARAGCDAVIRFDRRGTVAASVASSDWTRAGSGVRAGAATLRGTSAPAGVGLRW